MSTAVLMSGQARSFGGTEIPEDSPRAKQPWARRTFENQYWYLYRQLDDPEFFVSLADDEHAHEVEPLLLSRYPKEKVHVEIITQPTLPEPPIERSFHSGYTITAKPQNILRDLWHRKRVWEFYRQSMVEHPHQIFLRVRPDIYFQRGLRRMSALEIPPGAVCCTPYWSSFGGVNDRFAIMGKHAAEVYFTAFDKTEPLLEIGCPFHPETLLAGALRAEDIRLGMAPVHFFTLRRNGDVVPMTLEESVIAYADRMMGV